MICCHFETFPSSNPMEVIARHGRSFRKLLLSPSCACRTKGPEACDLRSLPKGNSGNPCWCLVLSDTAGKSVVYRGRRHAQCGTTDDGRLPHAFSFLSRLVQRRLSDARLYSHNSFPLSRSRY